MLHLHAYVGALTILYLQRLTKTMLTRKRGGARRRALESHHLWLSAHEACVHRIEGPVEMGGLAHSEPRGGACRVSPHGYA
jgi:hypothetical protein